MLQLHYVESNGLAAYLTSSIRLESSGRYLAYVSPPYPVENSTWFATEEEARIWVEGQLSLIGHPRCGARCHPAEDSAPAD